MYELGVAIIRSCSMSPKQQGFGGGTLLEEDQKGQLRRRPAQRFHHTRRSIIMAAPFALRSPSQLYRILQHSFASRALSVASPVFTTSMMLQPRQPNLLRTLLLQPRFLCCSPDTKLPEKEHNERQDKNHTQQQYSQQANALVGAGILLISVGSSTYKDKVARCEAHLPTMSEATTTPVVKAAAKTSENDAGVTAPTYLR
jgi:hypothetical protein